MSRSLHQIIPLLAERRILVIGDVILDEYVIGRARRMSREAPIPVLEFESRRYIPGGAANPSANIVALGSAAVQIGVVGEDETADFLRHELDIRGIESHALIIRSGRPTTLKTRILAQMGLRFPQQIARIDTISREPIDRIAEAALLARLQRDIGAADAILISDYQNGLLEAGLIGLIRQAAHERSLPLIVDAQGALNKYAGCDLVKCNADDAAEYLRTELRTTDDFEQAVTRLCAELAIRQAMVITRGADGATVGLVNGEVTHLSAPQVSDVYDTVGAGDTWIAVLTLAVVAGASIPDAALLANIASGIVVRHVGNYTPSRQELHVALDDAFPVEGE
jgi:rfaE bifunctional protein kinase chain/domain